MATAGLYRRLLPSPPAIEFSSSDGKKLFMEAIQSGTMECFYRLISYFQTQSEPAYCGLATLAMVLNALAIDPGRKWKGPWRWFDESMLDCCEPLETVKAKGISFGKVVCLGQCAGAKVDAFRTNHSNIDDFRKFVIKCSTSDDCYMIVSYHRGTFKQTGSGHFSPIGGYHAGSDMALILDVARFKYPPHWVPLELLWEAMDLVDRTTGQRRGFMIVSRPHRDPGMLYTLSCKHESWAGIAKGLVDEVPLLLLKSEDVRDIRGVLSVIFTSLPSNFGEFIKWVAEVRRGGDVGRGLSHEEKARLVIKEEVLKQVKGTGLYEHVVDYLSWASSCCTKVPSSDNDSLSNIAASVCCQGAEILAGKCSSSKEYYCLDTCVKWFKDNGEKPITVVSGTAVNGNSEQGVDILVPSSPSQSSCCHSGQSNCTGLHPASNDVLTALLLALPRESWSGIRDEKLLQEIYSLVATDNLPILLQEEVLHLRRQLSLLKRCGENKADEDLCAPLF